MKTLDISEINLFLFAPSVVTIGFFDGVHLGHQKILKQVQIEKKKHSLQSIIITFDDALIEKFKMKNQLQCLSDKLETFEQFEVDYVILIRSDSPVLHFLAKQFVEQVLYKINTKVIVAGSDFSFGHDHKGNASFLKKETSLEVVEVADVIINENKITSSYIRMLISEGKIALANQYLYQPFHLASKVIHGNKIGRTIDFKTANLAILAPLELLKHGVYFGYVCFRELLYKAMINVGYNPTVSATKQLKVEVFILQFDQMIYDETLTVYFLTYHREEKKFSDKEKLKEQLEKDVSELKQIDFLEK